MKSIRGKLTLRLMVGGILLLGLAGIMLQWRMRKALTGEFDDSLRLTAQSLQAFVEEKDHGVKMDSDVDGMPQFNRKGGASIFLLRTTGNREIKRSRSLGKEALPPTDAKDSRIFETNLEDGRKLRCLSQPIVLWQEHDDDKRSAPLNAVLIVGRVRTPLEHTLNELRNALLAAGGITLAALIGLVLWGVRGGLRPLDHLVADVSAIDGDSLSTRLSVDPLPSELRPIAVRLNELLGRLESVFSREKRFTANVAHELRTPLAELQALAEVNLMVPPETPAENKIYWNDVRLITARMESLALRLLELARTEQPGSLVRKQPVNLTELLEATWKRLLPHARERGITLELSAPSPCEMESDPVLLDMIVSNLFGNAIQHAAVDSVFRVSVEPGVIRFTNRAPDLAGHDLPNLFERFWKKDTSRTDGSRHGLGLALAAEAAALLGGSLDARLAEEDWLEFTLRLPGK